MFSASVSKPVLSGMQISILPIMENSMNVPQKTKTKTSIWSNNLTTWYMFKGNELSM
jgi:hypothetical protein